MKTASWNKATHVFLISALVVAALLAAATPAGAGVRVWADTEWDVYATYHDVAISVQADRDCYTTLFIVDTDGYVHVLRPFASPRRAHLRAGRTYRYAAAELGLNVLHGRGIAYVFAVGSSHPFDYSRWDEGIHVGHYGYRVVGDPYLACRELAWSFLPSSCDRSTVTVSSARFYIGEWARYPSYLCGVRAGVHVRVGDVCRECSRSYDDYREHANAPERVFHSRWLDGVTRHMKAVRRSTVSERETVMRSRETVTRKTTTRRARVISTRLAVKSSKSVSAKQKQSVFAKQQGASRRVASTSASSKPTSEKRPSKMKRASVRRTAGGVGTGSASKAR